MNTTNANVTYITKQQALEILMTMRALESFVLSIDKLLPEYLFENLTRDMEVLRGIVLGDGE